MLHVPVSSDKSGIAVGAQRVVPMKRKAAHELIMGPTGSRRSGRSGIELANIARLWAGHMSDPEDSN